MALSYLFANIFNILLKDYRYDMLTSINYRDMSYMEYVVKFSVKYSVKSLAIVAVIIYVIVWISKNLANRKIEKRNIVEAVKNTGNVKNTGKHTECPKIIAKLFNIEGIIAYKHVKEDKSRYKTIVISLIASIMLFLCANGIVDNFYKSGILTSTNINYLADYGFRLDGDQDEESGAKIVEYLEENNLITDYCFFSSENIGNISVPEEKIAKDMKKWVKKEFSSLKNGNIRMKSIIQCFYGKSYDKVLNMTGVNSLNDNEVILINDMRAKTKYYKNTNLTTYQIRR